MAVFELGGALSPALSELAIGPWRYAPDLPAFDAAGEPESVWSVGLARDDMAGRAALTRGERSIAETHALLDAAPRQLERALANGIPSWSVETERDPGLLERALLRAGDLARGRSRIETRVDDALVARTLTSLSGDLELWIAPGLSSSGAELHARSVGVAVSTRHAWARILTQVLQWASRIAALGTTGGLAAVAMAWRLLRDLLRGIRGRSPAPAP